LDLAGTGNRVIEKITKYELHDLYSLATGIITVIISVKMIWGGYCTNMGQRYAYEIFMGGEKDTWEDNIIMNIKEI
jgi:hypothetical protein